jgi:hypothetical protein
LSKYDGLDNFLSQNMVTLVNVFNEILWGAARHHSPFLLLPNGKISPQKKHLSGMFKNCSKVT